MQLPVNDCRCICLKLKIAFSLRPTSCSQYESQFLRKNRLSSVY